MLNILETLEPAGSPADPEDQLCLRLGEMLGIDKPVPAAALRRALVDESFALYLIRSQGQRELVALLLSDPRNDAYAAAPGAHTRGDESEPLAVKPQSDLALLVKAGKAVARWGASGFARVEPERFESRFRKCEACEYLAAPPDRLIYRVRLTRQSDARVCTACGCVASRKAALPTESCPVADTDNPRVNRWGEPRWPEARAS